MWCLGRVWRRERATIRVMCSGELHPPPLALAGTAQLRRRGLPRRPRSREAPPRAQRRLPSCRAPPARAASSVSACAAATAHSVLRRRLRLLARRRRASCAADAAAASPCRGWTTGAWHRLRSRIASAGRETACRRRLGLLLWRPFDAPARRIAAASRAQIAYWTTWVARSAWAPSAAASGTSARGCTTRLVACRLASPAASRCALAPATRGGSGLPPAAQLCVALRPPAVVQRLHCPRPSVAEQPCFVQTMRFEAPRLGGSFAVWGGLFSAFDCTLVAVRKKARAGAALATATPQPSRTRRATARAARLTRPAGRRRTPGTQSAPARSPADSCRCAPACSTLATRAHLTRYAASQLRHGLASAGRSAAFGGVLLAGIEGIGILITRMTAPPPPPGLDEMAVGAMAGAGAGAGGLAAAPPAPAADGPLGAPASGGDAGGGGGWFGGMWGGSSRKAGQSTTGGAEQPPMPDFGGGSGGGIKFE